MQKSEKLSLKQRKWLDSYIETGNATEAARQAGYSGNDDSLRVIGHENLTKLNPAISELMDRMGMTDVLLMKKLAEGLNANLVKTATSDGSITDERVYVDFSTRHQYLDTALKLKNRYPPQKQFVAGSPDEPVPVVVIKGVSIEDLTR